MIRNDTNRPYSEAPSQSGRRDGREEGNLNLLVLTHRLLRGRYWMLVLLLLIGGAVGAIAGYRTTQLEYRSVGVLQITPQMFRLKAWTSQDRNMPGASPYFYNSYISSQMKLLESQQVLTEAVKRIDWRGLGWSGDVPSSNYLRKRLEVMHPRQSELIQVSFVDERPEIATAAARAIISTYQEFYGNASMQERIGELERRKRDLNKSLATVRTSIETQKQRYGMDDYQYESKRVRLESLEQYLFEVQLALSLNESTDAQGQPKNLSMMQLAGLDPALANLITKKQNAELRVNSLLQRYQEGHPDVQVAQKEIAVLEQQIEERAEMLRQDGIGTGVLNDRNSDSKFASSRELLLEQQKKLLELKRDVEAEFVELGRIKATLSKLEQEESELESEYEAVKDRIEVMRVESSLEGSVNVISYGDRPMQPISDSRTKKAAAYGMVGAAAASMIVVLIGLAQRRVRDSEDVRLVAGGSGPLGTIPDLDRWRTSAAAHSSMLAYAVYRIRTNLQVSPETADARVLAVTSPSHGDGKTSLTVGLALSWASSRVRTLVIDFDLTSKKFSQSTDHRERRIGEILAEESSDPAEQPINGQANGHRNGNGQPPPRRTNGPISDATYSGTLHGGQPGESPDDYDGYTPQIEGDAAETDDAVEAEVRPQRGLFDALGGTPVNECVFETGYPNLFVMPLGPSTARDISRVDAAALNRMITRAAEQFDIILIDTGPIPISLEAMLATKQADSVLVTVTNRSKKSAIRACLKQLSSIEAHLGGVVVNRARQSDPALIRRVPTFDLGESSSGGKTSPEQAKIEQKFDQLGPVVKTLLATGAHDLQAKHHASASGRNDPSAGENSDGGSLATETDQGPPADDLPQNGGDRPSGQGPDNPANPDTGDHPPRS